MKKNLLLLLIFISSFVCKAQVVFCPPGAEWHYLFNKLGFIPGNSINETIKYTGDTIMGLDTVKILSHRYFFLRCSPIITKTLIKQKGDTVFFKNSRSLNTWQILYNFASLPGQTWQTSVLQNDNSTTTFTYSVDSIKQIDVNGYTLKNLYVTASSLRVPEWINLQITERYGCSEFLFNFDNKASNVCDAEYFSEKLCYEDDSFGIVQFGTHSCDYFTVNSVSLDELAKKDEEIVIFPNPTTNFLNIHLNQTSQFQLIIRGLSGREIKKSKLDQDIQLDLRDLKSGVYFLSILENKQLKYASKIIKE